MFIFDYPYESLIIKNRFTRKVDYENRFRALIYNDFSTNSSTDRIFDCEVKKDFLRLNLLTRIWNSFKSEFHKNFKYGLKLDFKFDIRIRVRNPDFKFDIRIWIWNPDLKRISNLTCHFWKKQFRKFFSSRLGSKILV